MGGQAFSSLELLTPRMPPDVYQKVLSQVQAQLRTVYAQAETPIEGPAKTDYGDIDVSVVAREDADQPAPEQLAELLGAKHYLQISNNSTTHFALPWPEDGGSTAGSDKVEEETLQNNRQDDSQQLFIQVDVNVSLTVQKFRFTLFQHAHGDFCVILGAILRRFGFIITPSGFYVSIAELEGWNKNLARFKLTDEPNTVLRYLGLDEQRYWSKFDSWNEAMDYISACRFHDPRRGEQYDNEDVPLKFEVKAHDRSKSSKRPMFRYWLDTYLPEHRKNPIGQASQLSKKEVINDMKKFFGEQTAKEFDTRRETLIRNMGSDKLWSGVRKALPCTGADLTYTMKGLKFEVMEMRAQTEDKDLKEIQSAFANGNFDSVRTWVNLNWEEVQERQKQRDRAQSRTKLLEHLSKEESRAASSPDSGNDSTPGA